MKRRKKITVVSGIFNPDIGGPASYLHNLLPALYEDGFDLKVITFGDSPAVPSYPFPVYKISRQGLLLKRVVQMSEAILRLCGADDLLYVNDYGFPPYLANLILRKPIVMKIVGDFAWEQSINNGWTTLSIDDFQSAKNLPMRARVLQQIQQRYVRSAQRIITPSNYLKRIIMGWGVPEAKIEVIYNSVKAMPSLTRECRNYFQLITVCRLVKWKGVETLIDVLWQLNQQGHNICLQIVGDGPLWNELNVRVQERALESKVQFLGSLDSLTTRKYISGADAFILNSSYEGLSHVILEAMISRIPVMASDRGGNCELIAQGRGQIFCYNDQSDICAKILKLKALSSSESERVTSAAYDFVQQDCTFNVMYSKTKAILSHAE